MLIVANWKAYVDTKERAQTLFAHAKRVAAKTKVSLVLAPPAPLLGFLAHKNKSRVSFASQDLSSVVSGAHTGEVSAEVYARCGASYALIGHSERRARGETSEDIVAKVRHALVHGLTPILCVGERERDSDGRYLAFIREEIASVFAELSTKDRLRVVLAYEPIWAIGKSALEAISPMDLSEIVLYIRKILAEFLPGKSNMRVPVLYGGSVEAENARTLAASSGIEGFLVGHASVDPLTFSKLVKTLE